MNNSIPQKDMPIAKYSSYAGGNGHIILSPALDGPTTTSLQEDQRPYKRVVRYKECLKNHAAAIGGNATDGCGDFMPSGEEGTLEALNCSACNCHRNFHRKEIEGECSSDECYHSPIFLNNGGSKLFLGHHNGVLGSPQGYPTNFLIPSRAAPPHHQMIMYYKSASVPSESDEKDDDAGGFVPIRPTEKLKKRFRTKFTQEQKEKLLSFAEKAGWRIQKLEESVVQQFCQEIGIKRRVLKVWMHNNKHSLAKKNSTS